ncbi:MAG: MgtC/SapB transporter [Peptococcaceae bacterium BICA1-7]|nr:MAG: MgtC/SapB transporter [Peptococcaceae bacterium BICA1-7]HBV99358.1 MgtC/SapB transporter [Desulfotomaculum sp.]
MQDQFEIILRLVLSFMLGGLFGLERERRHKPAGLRTHTLVCLGAALFTIAGSYGFPLTEGGPLVRDPARVSAQIVSGVGFIGGGIIFKERDHVRGITTAASIWLTAGLGMGIGLGLYLITGVAALLGLAGLALDRLSRS